MILVMIGASPFVAIVPLPMKEFWVRNRDLMDYCDEAGRLFAEPLRLCDIEHGIARGLKFDGTPFVSRSTASFSRLLDLLYFLESL